VNRFAELLDALLFSPSRNGKLRLMQEYFATQPDPERGWALAALTGELSFAEAKPNQVRTLAIERVDPELFGWSLDFVGDLALPRLRGREDRRVAAIGWGPRVRAPVSRL
jgi:DNA ligase-1